MKKLLIITGIIAVLMFIIICVFYLILPFIWHVTIINNARNYEPVAILSDDGKYILQTERIEEKSGVHASFSIIISSTNEVIYNCPDNYRTRDLYNILWDENSYNVIVKSGDVGTIIYEYKNSIWEKRTR